MFLGANMIRMMPLFLLACSESNFNNLENDEKGNGPKIEVNPDSINFGTVTADGTPVIQSFEVKNVGRSDLMVEDIQIAGDDASQLRRATWELLHELARAPLRFPWDLLHKATRGTRTPRADDVRREMRKEIEVLQKEAKKG